MKTLKHLTLVALLCFGASAFAAPVHEINQCQTELQKAKTHFNKGEYAKARELANKVSSKTDQLIDDSGNLTENQLNEVIDLNTEARETLDKITKTNTTV